MKKTTVKGGCNVYECEKEVREKNIMSASTGVKELLSGVKLCMNLGPFAGTLQNNKNVPSV